MKSSFAICRLHRGALGHLAAVLVAMVACGAPATPAETPPPGAGMHDQTSDPIPVTAPVPRGAGEQIPSPASRRATPPAPPPPREPRSDANACERDGECAFEPPSSCDCPPCGWQWRRAANRRHVEWLERELARENCPRVECVGCDLTQPDGGWLLGTRAVCVGGQCVAR